MALSINNPAWDKVIEQINSVFFFYFVLDVKYMHASDHDKNYCYQGLKEKRADLTFAEVHMYPKI